MGPKVVRGEYVDGRLARVSDADAGDPDLMAEAREVWAIRKDDRMGILRVDALYQAMGDLQLLGLLDWRDDDLVVAGDGGGGSGGGGGRGDDDRARRMRALSCAVFGEHSRMSKFRPQTLVKREFLQLARNLYGAGGYDGAVSPTPGVDTNWAVTSYAFAKPGRHTVEWRGLEPFAAPVDSVRDGGSATHLLRIDVVEGEVDHPPGTF